MRQIVTYPTGSLYRPSPGICFVGLRESRAHVRVAYCLAAVSPFEHNRAMVRLLVLLFAFVIVAHEAVGEQRIIGQASVIDGDTLEIHGTRIRLHGIDAPESEQLCIAKDKKFRCGQRAALALSDKIGNSTVSCDPRDIDRYNRVVAVCSAGGENLNGWLVASGWAMAYRHYSTDYIPHEQRASAAKLGIWQGAFVPPWDWRQGKRLKANEVQQSGDCLIKGNISVSSGERIYHVPGGQYYDRTKISPSKGERWFCSEAEAQAAGWRRSKR